jgi:hypothetical protein
MLKAGSLLYATVMALIIAMVSGSLMLFSYFKEQEKVVYLTQEALFRNALSGIQLAIASDSLISVGDNKYFDLYGNNTDSISIKKMNWGSYQVILSKAFSRAKSRQKAALLGAEPDSTCKSALYLQDNGKPLTLCGKTYIRGICYLPQSGVTRGNIEGKYFEGEELINGKIESSRNNMPAIDKSMIGQMQSYFLKKEPINDSVMYYGSVQQRGSISNSFFNKTIRIYSHGKIILSGGSYYSGNILITSDTEVVVSGNCFAKDIIIFAPIVRVESPFNGDVQIYASDSICVAKSVKFTYPSVLGIIRNKVAANGSDILLGDQVSIAGNVFGYNEMESTNEQILITIGKEDTIRGQVFTTGQVNFSGTVYGNISCSHFITISPKGEYMDYLVDVTMDVEKRSKYFINTLLVKSAAKSIVKWVY